MADERNCATCGATLPPDAPGGACPMCLLGAGLEGEATVPGEGAAAAARQAPSPEEIGRHFPTLELLELLGQGGMGIVYKARHRNLDRLVALKVLPPEVAREPGFADRFTREARTLARLQHPHIVGVHDFGETDGLFYLLMEYVDGPNLREVIRAGKLTPPEALAIVPQICDALQYAHEQGVVHRDIKPENVLMDAQGKVRIADFGLAKLLHRTPVDLRITRTGQVMGTLHYMAPEQYKNPDDVDHRADIFSLGVVFYEMLTGEVPLGRFEPPSHHAGVDARLDKVVLRALERERDQRYQNVSEVKTAVTSISGIAAGATPAAAPPGAKPPVIAAARATPAAPPPPPVPAGPPRWSRLAVAASVMLAATPLLLVSGFGWNSFWWILGSLVVGFAGWILSMAAWATIHHAVPPLKGKGIAVAGTFLPPFLLCAGVVLSPILFLGAAAEGGNFVVKDGPEGRTIRLPWGMEIVEGPDGRTRVRMPGLEVEDGPGGSRVRMPGIDIDERRSRPAPPQVPEPTPPANALPAPHAGDSDPRVQGGPPGATEEARESTFREVEAAWRRLHDLAAAGRLDLRAAEDQYPATDIARVRALPDLERRAEVSKGSLGLPLMVYAGQPFDLEGFTLAAVRFDPSGYRARALIRKEGARVDFPLVFVEKGWKFEAGNVHWSK